MGKHAYLIIAHNNFYVLEKTLELIDDERNDIYIHIDKKVKNFDFAYHKNICKQSNVYYTKKRYNVRWGNYSQVKTEMELFEEAYRVGYDYYHLMSGADMPIKSQDFIHSFFESNKYEFISSGFFEMYRLRVSKYHFDGMFPKRICEFIDVLQNKFKIDRIKKSRLIIYKGSNWASLSHLCVGLLIENKKKIKKLTRLSLCADEIYKQTIILNLNPKAKIWPYDDIRLIDWERSEGFSPHTFTIDDYEMIRNSTCLFARKFLAEKDQEIVDKVFCLVKMDVSK